jgi:glucose-1-phosphate cytidylyltransferase
MKVVILCGGKGTRLREETEFRPKPMVEIGGHPILWHIMLTYAYYGYNDFVLCLGYKGDVIREYFYHYAIQNRNFTINLRSGECKFHRHEEIPDWRVTLVDTGQETLTGGRVKKIEPYIDDDEFFLTYGDGLSDINITESLEFHRSHGKVATVTGVSPPSRYGELFIQGDHVKSFQEKSENSNGRINGGYFVFSRKLFDYLEDREDCILEREPLEKLAVEGELCVKQHNGFWQCMDTYRDYKYLNNMWQKGQVPWEISD